MIAKLKKKLPPYPDVLGVKRATKKSRQVIEENAKRFAPALKRLASK